MQAESFSRSFDPKKAKIALRVELKEIDGKRKMIAVEYWPPTNQNQWSGLQNFESSESEMPSGIYEFFCEADVKDTSRVTINYACPMPFSNCPRNIRKILSDRTTELAILMQAFPDDDEIETGAREALADILESPLLTEKDSPVSLQPGFLCVEPLANNESPPRMTEQEATIMMHLTHDGSQTSEHRFGEARYRLRMKDGSFTVFVGGYRSDNFCGTFLNQELTKRFALAVEKIERPFVLEFIKQLEEECNERLERIHLLQNVCNIAR